jgi:hypothetical protein
MNINETNINGLEDVYNYIQKASKAHVQSGNLSLIKNLVLKVLDSLNKGNCDYDSATNAIEDIFSIGRRANKYQTVPESTRVDTALEILKENNYEVEKVPTNTVYIAVMDGGENDDDYAVFRDILEARNWGDNNCKYDYTVKTSKLF